MNRRSFLSRSALGAGSLLLPGGKAHGQAATFQPYERVALGETGAVVSRLCMGTGVRGGNRQSNHTRMGQAAFTSLVRGGLERGINFFDLADLYGTHAYFAEAMRGVPREDYFICTKIWFRSGGIPEPERPDADVVVDRFLQELGTDYIDLLLLHCTVSPTWTTDQRRQMDLIEELQAQGKVRLKGTSCHSLEALRLAAADPWVDSVHARINPYEAAMDGPPDQVAPVLAQIKAAGKGVVGMKLMGEGRFRDSDEMRNNSIAYVLGLGSVDVLNVGFETLAEVDDFARRVQAVPR